MELKVSELNFSPANKQKLIKIIVKNLDAFAGSDDDLGCTSVCEQRINTGDKPPFRDRLRNLPWSRRPFVDNQLDAFERSGVIYKADPGDCPYASAIVVVSKKEVDPSKDPFRLCIDYRRLNADTVKDSYPLPRIDDILINLRGKKFFASVDLLSGYMQIGVDPADRKKTAFVTHRGLYVFN